MSDLNEAMLDKLTKVCLCAGIPRSTIKRVIAEGADTVEKVCKKTGAGTNACGGRRCRPKIQELIDQYNEMKNEEVL